MNQPFWIQLAMFGTIILEILLPSGGLLFILALGFLIWSWVLILSGEPNLHLYLYLAIDIIGIPILLWYSLKVLEKSSFSLHASLDQDFHSPDAWDHLKGDLEGLQGVVTQSLRPIGKVLIELPIQDSTSELNDESKFQKIEVEALSQRDWIEEGSKIMVLSTKENKVIVKQI